MAEARFAAFGESEIQIDDVTRRRHRARLSRRLATAGRAGCPYGPVEALGQRASRYVPRSSRGPGQPLELLVGLWIDPHTRRLHANQHTQGIGTTRFPRASLPAVGVSTSQPPATPARTFRDARPQSIAGVSHRNIMMS